MESIRYILAIPVLLIIEVGMLTYGVFDTAFRRELLDGQYRALRKMERSAENRLKRKKQPSFAE